MLKVKNRNPRKRCEIYPTLTVKAPEQRHWRRSGVFIVNFQHISHLFLMLLLLDFEQVDVNWFTLNLHLLITSKLLFENILLSSCIFLPENKIKETFCRMGNQSFFGKKSCWTSICDIYLKLQMQPCISCLSAIFTMCNIFASIKNSFFFEWRSLVLNRFKMQF